LEPPHSADHLTETSDCRVVSVIARGFCKVTQRTASVIRLTKTTGKKVGNGTACGSQRRAAVVQQATESCCIFPHSLRVRQRRRRAGGIAVRCVMMKTTHITRRFCCRASSTSSSLANSKEHRRVDNFVPSFPIQRLTRCCIYPKVKGSDVHLNRSVRWLPAVQFTTTLPVTVGSFCTAAARAL